MHLPFRPHLLLLAAALALLGACETHDRMVYSERPVKNLRVPRPGVAPPAPAARGAAAAAETVVINPGEPAPVAAVPGAGAPAPAGR